MLNLLFAGLLATQAPADIQGLVLGVQRHLSDVVVSVERSDGSVKRASRLKAEDGGMTFSFKGLPEGLYTLKTVGPFIESVNELVDTVDPAPGALRYLVMPTPPALIADFQAMCKFEPEMVPFLARGFSKVIHENERLSVPVARASWRTCGEPCSKPQLGGCQPPEPPSSPNQEEWLPE